jgi:hypothetical protein
MAANFMVEQLAILFGEPRTADPGAFIAAYSNTLHKVPRETLMDATDILVRQRRISGWPTIAECLDAVALAKKQGKSRGIGLEPIDDFEGWYGGLMAQINHADNQLQVDAAIAQIEPYARALWCFPHRLDDAREAGQKRMKHLRAAGARNPTGERE